MPTNGEQPTIDSIHVKPTDVGKEISYKQSEDSDSGTEANINPTPKYYVEQDVGRISDVEIAQKMAEATQEGYQAAEKIEENKLLEENNPLILLKEKITDGLSINKDRYSIGNKVQNHLVNKLNNVKNFYKQEKLVSDASNLEIIQEAFVNKNGNYQPFNVFDLNDLYNGYTSVTDNTRCSQNSILEVMKSLEIIPKESPGSESFPSGKEMEYLSKLITKNGDVKIEKTSSDQGEVTLFTKATSIDGVNMTIGIRSADLQGKTPLRGQIYIKSSQIELSPQFVAKALGVPIESK